MLTRLRNLALVLALPLAACAPTTPTGTAGGAVQSCFDTSDGTVCVETPAGAATDGVDANGDGTVDPFICADDDSDGDGSIDAFDDDDDDDGIDDSSDPDDDDDGTPDQGSGDAPGTAGSDEDGGSSSDSDDNGVDDSIQCGACDRGPGESGQFRIDIDDDGEIELERGTVSSVSGATIIVTAPAPVVIGGTTVTDIVILTDGVPASIVAGAEIRVRGVANGDGSITADRLELLCAP